MMGRTHAATGLALGAVTLPLLPTDNAGAQIAWIAVTGGAALIPDLDHPNATASTMWGPVTGLAHQLARRLGRGHRVGTHDPLLAPIVFGLLTWLCALHSVTAVLPIAGATGLALHACSRFIPGKHERRPLINLAVSITVGVLVVTWAPEQMRWLPAATALGVLLAIAGDACTKQGVVVPLTWITGQERRTRGLPIVTGGGVEVIVRVVAYAATAAGLCLGIQPIHDLLASAVDATRASTLRWR